MVIVMEKHTAEGNIERVMSELIKRGFDVHRSTGSDQTVLGVVGQVDTIDTREFELFDGVQEVVRISEPYKLSSRSFRREKTPASVPASLSRDRASPDLRRSDQGRGSTGSSAGFRLKKSNIDGAPERWTRGRKTAILPVRPSRS